MACDCTETTRGGWQGDRRTILWGVKSKCETRRLDFPDSFAPSGERADSGSLRAERQQAPEQQAVRISDEEVANPAGGIQTCCVIYKIGWRVAGLAQGEQVIVTFSAGDDSWGPFRSGPANAQGQVEDAEEVSVCKENADCSKQKVGKLVVDRVMGAAGQPARIGTIGDISVCKLK